MNRPLAMLAALVVSALAVSSAIATPVTAMDFRMNADSNSRIQLRLYRADDRHNGSMTSGFAPNELSGLDVAALRQPGNHPIRFALIREAGRVDCTGSGGNAVATGRCGFTPDAGFTAMLESRGIGRPNDEQSYEPAMVGATRDLVDVLAAHNYPRPDIEKLVELSAVGVDRRYDSDLAA